MIGNNKDISKFLNWAIQYRCDNPNAPFIPDEKMEELKNYSSKSRVKILVCLLEIFRINFMTIKLKTMVLTIADEQEWKEIFKRVKQSKRDKAFKQINQILDNLISDEFWQDDIDK